MTYDGVFSEHITYVYGVQVLLGTEGPYEDGLGNKVSWFSKW